MEIDERQNSGELRLGELIAILWNSKLLIAAVTAIFVVIGCVVYFQVPPTYTSKVSIYPLQQTQFVRYLSLSKEKDAFPYTQATLFSEFTSYLRDADRLSTLAEKTGVVERRIDNDAMHGLRLARFISGIKFTTAKPLEVQAGGQQFLQIEAKGGSRIALQTFMQQLLLTANADMAAALSKEVRERASALKDQLESQVAKLTVDIDARRRTADNVRDDDIARLNEQSAIAHSLGLEKPLSLRAVEAAEQGKTASAQINNSGDHQPDYLQGYAALDERIAILRNRKSGDPFIADLRSLEQQLYIARHDPRPSNIVALLERSPLSEPGAAAFAQFDISSILAEKISPRLSIFVISSLSFGLMLGALIAFSRR